MIPSRFDYVICSGFFKMIVLQLVTFEKFRLPLVQGKLASTGYTDQF